MTLRELRQNYGITQREASEAVGVPLRTYVRYEKLEDTNDLKYRKIKELLYENFEITETKGILKIDDIINGVKKVCKEYEEVDFCYLFGSYAKGYAKEDSDIDFCIKTSLTGLKFVGFVEKLHQELKKRIDVTRFSDLKDNLELVNEIMKDGIKIYG